MTQLIDREIEVNIGGLLIASADAGEPVLRMSFNVTKTPDSSPNKSELKIWNLSEDSRSMLQEQDRLIVTIKAGYRDFSSQIFFGDMRFASSVRDSADWVTAVQSGDGAKQYKSARINKSFAAGTLVTDALKAAAESLGVGNGNLSKVIAAGSKRALREFSNGTVLTGKSTEQIDNLAKSMGLEWSVQDGQLQLLEPEQTTQDSAVVLSSGTGLIGSPTAGSKGVVKARSLLQPDIFPGRKIQIDSALIPNSFFKATKVKHTGDTWGSNWFTDMELKPL